MSDQTHSHSESHPHGDAHHEHEDHGGVGKYLVVFGLLCVLTSASVLTYTDMWQETFSKPVAWAFMMAVSCAKAMLVISFFMHLYWEANWKYVLTIPAAMMSVFLVCMLTPDIGYRWRNYSEDRIIHAAAPEAPSAHHDESHGGEGD